MIDRSSRAYLHYSDYRQPNSVKISNFTYKARQNNSVLTQSGRVNTSFSYAKKELENSLIKSNESSTRIKKAYSPIAQAINEELYNKYTYLGSNIDIKA